MITFTKTTTLNQVLPNAPGYVDIMGEATNTATVTVNDQPTYRQDEYFRAELTADNSASALWFGVTNLAVINDGTNVDIVASATGNVFVAQSPEMFGYDADGNRTNDGRWTLTWDGENRLLTLASLTNNPAESKRRLTFGYDYRGRRITKAVETWNGSAWAMTLSNKLVYDGWNLLAELNATNNAVIRTYVWGLDLSGSLQGAGGVAGLLAVNDAASGGHFCAFDGNGNVAALVNAGDGTESATYEYGPFGEVIRASGEAALLNPFRFSTKYQDDETDLLYYGYRYYDARNGGWLNRDPIEEEGGANLYAFTLNSPLNFVDRDGLDISITIRIPLIGDYKYQGHDTGYTLGMEWLLGTAKDRHYGPDHPMTKQIKSSAVVEMDRDKARKLFREYCKNEENGPIVLELGGELEEIPIWKYPFGRFVPDLISNPAGAFVGSFGKGSKIIAIEIDCCECIAAVHVHLVNVSGLPSATHLPPMGGKYRGSVLPYDITGKNTPMHTFKQTFDWDETIDFSPCH